jgi:ActD protein/heat induced stress protein YflT
MAKDVAVFGLFDSRLALEAAVDALRAAGFRAADVSVLGADPHATHELAHEINSKAPEGAVTGGAAGGAIGGVLGWLAGIGMITIPGVGPFLAAGPIVAALAGIGAGSATGGLIGALAGIGIPEVEAKRYEGRIRGGRILISVHADDDKWAKTAKEILKTSGAEEVSDTRERVADYHP